MKSLKEFMAKEPITPEPVQSKSLSPVHFRHIAKTPEEMNAYNAAYQQFLKYYDTDENKKNAFGKILHDALYDRDVERLSNWYHHYRLINNFS